jgi:hypothetical protein
MLDEDVIQNSPVVSRMLRGRGRGTRAIHGKSEARHGRSLPDVGPPESRNSGKEEMIDAVNHTSIQTGGRGKMR